MSCILDKHTEARVGDLMGYSYTKAQTSQEFAAPRPGVEIRLGQVTGVNDSGIVTAWQDHLGHLHTDTPLSRWIAPLDRLTLQLAQPITPEYAQAMVELSGPFPTLQDLQLYVLKYRRAL